jgi:hypothetical protein
LSNAIFYPFAHLGTAVSGTLSFNTNNLTKLGDSVFRECASLAGDLTLPNSITEIGAHAFAYDSGFNGNLTLPSSCIKINH